MKQLNDIKEKIKEIQSGIQRIEKAGISQIEKDVLLSEIRDVYMKIVDLEEVAKLKPDSVEKEIKTEEAQKQQINEEKTDEPEDIQKQPQQTDITDNIENLASESPEETQKDDSPKDTPDLFNGINKNRKIIGEELGKNNKSLNEKYAEASTGITGKINLSPLEDIKAGIGMGDKFLYIKELFKNDNELYNITIDKLNEMNSMDEALTYLDANFDWNGEDSTVVTFLNLVKRRYVGS